MIWHPYDRRRGERDALLSMVIWMSLSALVWFPIGIVVGAWLW